VRQHILLELFGWNYKPAEKHCWLIFCERKILFRLKKTSWIRRIISQMNRTAVVIGRAYLISPCWEHRAEQWAKWLSSSGVTRKIQRGIMCRFRSSSILALAFASSFHARPSCRHHIPNSLAASWLQSCTGANWSQQQLLQRCSSRLAGQRPDASIISITGWYDDDDSYSSLN
jgi:hypothetical protein